MKNVKLPLFFKSREYRNLYFKLAIVLIRNFMRIVSIPFVVVCQTIELYIRYPKKSERIEQVRKLGDKLDEKKRKEDRRIAYIELKGAIGLFDDCLRAHMINHRRKDLGNEYWEMVKQKFESAKETFLTYSKELEVLGVQIPDELKEKMTSTELTRFKSEWLYNDFSTTLYNLCLEIEI